MPLADKRKKTAVTPPSSRGNGASVDDAQQDVESRIYRSIFDGVMHQRLVPGTKLPESSLCELFQVKRSVVRKVLQKLAHDHIVELRPNRGAIIAVPSEEQMRQIFEARRGLESAILHLAARRANARDLAGLRRHLKEERGVVNRVGQPAWAQLAASFHLQLAALAGNEILERYLVELVSRCSLIVALKEHGAALCEHEEHAQIVECIARKDAEEAVRIMLRHLDEIERNILADREEGKPTLGRLLGLS